MTRPDGADERVHPAVVRARHLRRQTGLPASLVDVAVLSRVNNLFEHVGRKLVDSQRSRRAG